MLAAELHMEQVQVHKLLCAASGDAALLYLYLQSGNDLSHAQEALHMNEARVGCAAASLRQLGLWQEKKAAPVMVGERPKYSETDVVRAMDGDGEFRCLYEEIQRQLGRTLNTEELKILLGFNRYLGLDAEVTSLLVSYCKERARDKGSRRNPSLISIEKEAYAWAERGIDTMEEAVAYIQTQKLRHSRIAQLMEVLQIRGRNLTSGEERYAQRWLDWGFALDAIAIAYERTCLNTGGLNWPYMNKILSRWKEAGLLTAEAVQSGDQKPGSVRPSGQLGQAEREAIQRMLQEE